MEHNRIGPKYRDKDKEKQQQKKLKTKKKQIDILSSIFTLNLTVSYLQQSLKN